MTDDEVDPTCYGCNHYVIASGHCLERDMLRSYPHTPTQCQLFERREQPGRLAKAAARIPKRFHGME